MERFFSGIFFGRGDELVPFLEAAMGEGEFFSKEVLIWRGGVSGEGGEAKRWGVMKSKQWG